MNYTIPMILVYFFQMSKNLDLYCSLFVKPLFVSDHFQSYKLFVLMIKGANYFSEWPSAQHFLTLVAICYVVSGNKFVISFFVVVPIIIPINHVGLDLAGVKSKVIYVCIF